MPVCAKAIQQADGSLLLALDPANPDLSTCPYVVDDGASNAWRELGNMSIENAQQIGMMVGLLWAGAWGFRAIRKALSIDVPERD